MLAAVNLFPDLPKPHAGPFSPSFASSPGVRSIACSSSAGISGQSSSSRSNMNLLGSAASCWMLGNWPNLRSLRGLDSNERSRVIAEHQIAGFGYVAEDRDLCDLRGALLDGLAGSIG